MSIVKRIGIKGTKRSITPCGQIYNIDGIQSITTQKG